RALAGARHAARIELQDEEAVLGKGAGNDKALARAAAGELGSAVHADQRGVLLRRIERGGQVQQAVKRRAAVGGGVGEQLRLLQPEGAEARRLASRDLPERLAGARIDEPRRRRRVVLLMHVDEVAAVRRDVAGPGHSRLLRPRAQLRDAAADRVVKGGVGQPLVAAAVEADAVQLHFQAVVAIASGVEQRALVL